VTLLPAAGDGLGLRAWPNPFSTETAVEFALPAAGDVRLRVFDVGGRAVRTLTTGRREAGAHRVTWDARDTAGRRLGSGVYFYRVEAAGEVAVRKVVLLD
jgi:flagellar hook assembly protein FlgD